MERVRIRTLTGLLLLSLSGCASNGGFVKDGKEFDPSMTLAATCDTVRTLDIAFQSFVLARPELADTQGVAIQQALMRTVEPVCAAGYDGDVRVALRTVISVLSNSSAILEAWNRRAAGGRLAPVGDESR